MKIHLLRSLTAVLILLGRSLRILAQWRRVAEKVVEATEFLKAAVPFGTAAPLEAARLLTTAVPLGTCVFLAPVPFGRRYRWERPGFWWERVQTH